MNAKQNSYLDLSNRKGARISNLQYLKLLQTPRKRYERQGKFERGSNQQEMSSDFRLLQPWLQGGPVNIAL